MHKYALALIYRLGSFSTALMAPALLARIWLLVAPALVAPYSIVYKINKNYRNPGKTYSVTSRPCTVKYKQQITFD